MKPLKEIEIKENQSARFDCELNKSNQTVSWFHNGERIEKNDKNVTFIDKGKCHSLIVKKCDLNHIGRYTMKTTGPSSSASLYIEETPVEFIKSLVDVRVKEKETAVITCEINKENAEVNWLKNGVELTPDYKKYKFITNGNKYSLEILNAKLTDISQYTIIIRTQVCSASLEVEGLF